ncbi:MAG: membrane dipeptidase [Clostridia bacterium]|nr:membrane dipeptidase [Clostridia bacterium]
MRYCDLHCDLLNKITHADEWIFTRDQKKYQITPDGIIGGVFLQTFAVFASNQQAKMSLFYKKQKLFQTLKRYLSTFGVQAVLSVENGAFLEGNLENIAEFSKLGVKMLTLTWNGGNALGGSHHQEWGLTEFGEQAVEELAFYGILPDVSHLSEQGFWRTAEIMQAAHKPFVASHSCTRALCNHTRNLTDAQIRAIAQNGGVVGVNFYPDFLGCYSPEQHMAHILKVGGEDCVSVGSDFDGIDRGYYKDPQEAEKGLESRLKKEGFTARQREKALKSNALRVLGMAKG